MSDDMKTFIKKLRSALVVANVRHVGIELRHEEVVNLMHYLGDVEGIIEQSSLIEKELEAELDKYRWIPVGEKLPDPQQKADGYMSDNSDLVHVYPRPKDDRAVYYLHDLEKWSCSAEVKVTHWMPLPIPPEVNNE